MNPRPTPRRQDEGFILVAVLIVIMLASMVVVSLLFRVRAEETAAAAGAGSEQAWAVALSGIHEAMRVARAAAPGSLEWQDAPGLFKDRLIFDDGSDRWYFSIYSAGDPDRDEIRFGLTDEASKLNINEATEAMLEKLPKMTPYLVQGLLDFLDSDNSPRPEGAEQEYYDALPRPYLALNGPVATMNELLLVRGFTPSLLFGEDANWNFRLDANEDDGDVQFPPDNKDGKLDLGLRQFLTVYSADLNQDISGLPRVDLNNSEDPLSFKDRSVDDFPPAFNAYVEAARRNHVKIEHPSDLLEAKGKFKDEAGKEIELESGIGKTELPALLDRCTTQTNQRLPGLIDVNTASAKVLQVLPGIDEALADSIVSARRNLREEQRRTPAWLFQEGLVDADQFKKLCPYLTARGFQYHFHALGYGVPSSRYRVLEVVIDAGETEPRITYLRDITRLGLPFKIEWSTDGDQSSPGQAGDQATLRPAPSHRWSRQAALPPHG